MSTAQAMRVASGLWIWTPDPLAVHAGVADAEAAQLWCSAHGVTRLQFRDDPAVPAQGLATRPPVWVGQVDTGGWIAWDDQTFVYARPLPTLPQLREALVLAGRPWRLWTPAAVWARPQEPVPADVARVTPWYLGRGAQGVAAWHPTPTGIMVLADPAWRTVRDAMAGLAGHGVAPRGWCPGPVRRAFWHVRAPAGPRHAL